MKVEGFSQLSYGLNTKLATGGVESTNNLYVASFLFHSTSVTSNLIE
jgi:hypothetical protein